MRQLTDSITVDASPDRVWAWLLGLAEHYIEWHRDHVSAIWVSVSRIALGRSSRRSSTSGGTPSASDLR
jgi:hypothetical protein